MFSFSFESHERGNNTWLQLLSLILEKASVPILTSQRPFISRTMSSSMLSRVKRAKKKQRLNIWGRSTDAFYCWRTSSKWASRFRWTSKTPAGVRPSGWESNVPPLPHPPLPLPELRWLLAFFPYLSVMPLFRRTSMTSSISTHSPAWSWWRSMSSL